MSDDRRGPLGDPDEDGDEVDDHEHRRLFERAVPDLLRRLVERAVESGVERLSEGPENLRNLLGELKLPKDALHYLYGQIDDTKKGLYRVVAKEIRDVLEHTNFADEISKLLTKLSFEVSMQIRFVPNPQSLSARGRDEEPDDEGQTPDDKEEHETQAPESDGEPTKHADRWMGLPRPRVTSHVRVHTLPRAIRRPRR